MSSTNDPSPEENEVYKPGHFHYQDLPIEKRKQVFRARQKELNPCLKESDMARECLLMARDDHHKCDASTDNYKTCMRFWAAVRLFATSHNLARQDGFPPLAERPIWKKQLVTWIQTNKLTVPDELKSLV